MAGIVGISKFVYDLFGENVNVASKMESSGQPKRVHVSHDTYTRLVDKYVLFYFVSFHFISFCFILLHFIFYLVFINGSDCSVWEMRDIPTVNMTNSPFLFALPSFLLPSLPLSR